MLQKPSLVRLCVVMFVLFCRVFLSVAETIVGWPVWVLFSVFNFFVLSYLMITQSVVITRRKLG